MLLTCLLLFLSVVPTFAQGNTHDALLDIYSIEFVKQALQSPPGEATNFSFAEKKIGRMGDQLAVALIKIYDEQELSESKNIHVYLPLLRSAFASPYIISIQADKKPNVTIFLLRKVKKEIRDNKLRSAIDEAITFIQAQSGYYL